MGRGEGVTFSQFYRRSSRKSRATCSTLSPRSEQRGDDGDGVRTGVDDTACVGAGDAADGDERFGRERARAADAFEADDLFGVGLGSGGEGWANGDVVGCGQVGGEDLSIGLCVDTPTMRLGPMTRRASAGERSSWPTWTPSKAASAARSARSFRMRRQEVPENISRNTRGGAKDGLRGAPFCRGIGPVRRRRCAVRAQNPRVLHREP